MIVGLILHKQFCPLKIPQILSSHLTFNFLSSLRVPIKPLLFLKISQFAPPTDPSPKKNEFFYLFLFFCDMNNELLRCLTVSGLPLPIR